MLFAKLIKVLIIFTLKKRKRKPCNFQRSLKRYYENKEKLSNEQKLYHEKNREVLIAKSKINQQKRKYEEKTYRHQIEELKKC